MLPNSPPTAPKIDAPQWPKIDPISEPRAAAVTTPNVYPTASPYDHILLIINSLSEIYLL